MVNMKIALFGATGGTGQEIIIQALARSDEVQALVREPTDRLPARPGLVIIPGDILDQAKVTATIEGTEAVICTLGGRAHNPDDMLAQGTRNIILAMKAEGLKRLVVVTSLGVGNSVDQVPTGFKILMRTVIRKEMQDKEQQEAVVRESGLDWVIVRPGGLVNGPATGAYRVGTGRDIVAGQVSRSDVAAFVLAQLSDDTFLYQAPAIT